MCAAQQEMMMAPTQPVSGPNYALMGFLAAAIAVVGMVGVMATYIAPLPLHRAIAREAVLDQLLADNGADYAKLTRQLADSAEAVKPGPDLGTRIAAERVAMRARLQAESDGTAARLRVMALVCTLVAMLFGAVALGAGRKRR